VQRFHASTGIRKVCAGLVPLVALAGCAAATAVPPPGPAVTSITVAHRSWHTDICLRSEDADARVAELAAGFPGARFLCIGFGERQYTVRHDHGVLTMIGAMFPSQAALLLTALRAPPAAAFGADQVVSLAISRAGLSGLDAYLWRSTQTGADGTPTQLGNGPYVGSVYYAATGTYWGLHTCNTWTATGLRAAGLPIDDAVLLASEVMSQARRIAAAQGGGAP
jgi:hypothetical protein